MKSFSLASLVLAVLLGVAVAWIRPAQPVQVAQPGAFLAAAGDGLDNPAVTADPNIHPARKCKYYYCYSLQPSCLLRASPFASSISLYLSPVASLLSLLAGGFCMGVSHSSFLLCFCVLRIW